MAQSPVSFEMVDGIAVVTIDNGKANVLSPEVVALLDEAVDRAEKDDDVGALVIMGTPGFLSGGFDLAVMMESPSAAGRLVVDGGALFTRLFGSPTPVVVACPGHAVAAGALLLLVADERIGAQGDFKIGLIETAKGMHLPRWAVELAHERLSPRHRQLATVGARMYDPDGAVEAGFLDEAVAADDLTSTAMAAGQAWAALPQSAYERQIEANRGLRLAALADAIAADRDAIFTIDA